MKLLLVLLISSHAHSGIVRQFLGIITSVAPDYSDNEIEDMINSEASFKESLAANMDVFYSPVELLIGAEQELETDEEEELMAGGPGPNLESLIIPDHVDVRELDIMHAPIYQGGCGSCGFVSGTQTLEARMALVSENHIPYAIQNFMNCKHRICTGAQPFSINTYAKQSGFIVPESEMAYTKRECLKWGPGTSGCLCGDEHPDQFTNALDDQFAVILGTRSAQSEAQLLTALQSGPVTTCYSGGGKKDGEGQRCTKGCTHANSIIGYNDHELLIQVPPELNLICNINYFKHI